MLIMLLKMVAKTLLQFPKPIQSSKKTSYTSFEYLRHHRFFTVRKLHIKNKKKKKKAMCIP